MKKCRVEKCENKYFVKEYCQRHYDQMRLHGKILKRTMFDKNEFIDCGEYYEICLYSSNKAGEEPKEKARALIDKDDYEKIKDYKWCLNGDGYAITRINKKILFLHHLIKPRHEFLLTEHHDTNPLNNKKDNLRYATKSQNGMNRKSKGYYWKKEKNKWQAKININKKQIHLGFFTKKEDAIKARRKGELKHFKEFRYKY